MIVNEYTYGKYVVELTVEEADLMERTSPLKDIPRSLMFTALLSKVFTDLVRNGRKGG